MQRFREFGIGGIGLRADHEGRRQPRPQLSELWWDQNIQKFYTDREVRIATKSKNIYGGKGLEATQDLNQVIIKYPSGTALVNEF